MTPKECLLRKAFGKALRHVEVCLVTQFFNEFVSWGGVEDVMFDWDVFIIQLVEETKRRNTLGVGVESSLSELASD